MLKCFICGEQIHSKYVVVESSDLKICRFCYDKNKNPDGSITFDINWKDE